MPNNGDWQAVLEQILKIQAFLDRPVIRWQLAAFIIAALAAWLLSDGLWRWGGHGFSAWVNNRLGEKGQRYWQRGVLFIQYLTFPILGLVAIQITVNIFQAQGWRTALIAEWSTLFWFILYYRLLIIVFYIVLGDEFMRRYHYRLFAPMFGLFITYRILDYLITIDRLADVVLLRPFGNPMKLGTLVTAIVALYFLFVISRAIQDLLQGVIVPRTNADPNVVNAALTIGRYLVIGSAVIIVAVALGADLRTLAFISGGLSVGIGFGLQEIVANFVSGLVLLFEQSLRPGDVVEVDGEIVIVDKLGIRATTVHTFGDVEIIIPNQTFLTSSVKTSTKTKRIVRTLIPVGVSYNSNPEEVREVLLKVAGQHPDVQKEPEPVVYFADFGSSSLDFQLGVWIDPVLTKRVRSALRFMIWDALAKHNIEIPYPQRDLHLRSGIPWDKLAVNSRVETIEPDVTEDDLTIEKEPQ